MPRRKQNKTLKYSGKPHINKFGIPKLGRSMRPPCNETCRQKCYQKITESQRQQLFNEYYNLADLHRQWQYLGRYLDKTVPKRRSISNPPIYKYKDRAAFVVERQRSRKNNVKYFLQTDKERLHVCKNIFLATFDITEHVIRTVCQKTDEKGVLVQKDGRGYRPFRKENQNLKQLDDSSSSSGMVDRENLNCTLSES